MSMSRQIQLTNNTPAIPDVVGQQLRKMVPDETDRWAEFHGGVLRTTGKPIRFERKLVATGHTRLPRRIGSQRQVAVPFEDITARKRAAQACGCRQCPSWSRHLPPACSK
jgi:hypothetical protein